MAGYAGVEIVGKENILQVRGITTIIKINYMGLIKSILLRIYGRFRKRNLEYMTADPSSILLPATALRFDTRKEDRKYVVIGKKCLISSSFVFESEKGMIEIGDNVHIGGCMMICRTKITISDDVTMAWGITLYDHNSHSVLWEHRQKDNPQCYEDFRNHGGNNVVNKDWTHVVGKPITIGPKVWIGFNVTILKGVTIGEGAVVGACSVVTKDVEPWTVVAGNPAVVIKKLQ
jgi:galactoside O-acetyltransferase